MNQQKEQQLSGNKKEPVTSRILGVVYTDIVVYIVPGFFLGLCVLLIFKYLCKFIHIISGKSFPGSLGIIIAVFAVSYILGILISFIRWHVYPYGKSIGDILYKDPESWRLKRADITRNIQETLLKKINKDIELLGWKHKAIDPIESEENMGKPVNSRKYSERDYDVFGLFLLNSLRESGLYIHDYYERWTDIDEMRKNLIISIQLALITLCFKIGFAIETQFIDKLFLCGFILLLVFLLILFYLYILPILRYRHLRLVLLYYLSGRLKIFEE